MSAVKQTSAQVEEFLQAEFGESFSKVRDDTYFAKRGSAVVGLSVHPWGEDDAVVQIQAKVVGGARLNEELLRQLLEFNHGAVYGSFGLDEEGSVSLHHSLLGSTLSKAELVPVVLEIAKVADDWDDVIIAEAGGKTAEGLLKEQVAGKKKPVPVIEAPAVQEPQS